MSESMFYCHVKITDKNKKIISKVEEYSHLNQNIQIYIINSPLGEKYKYDYEDNVLVILSPNHKIIILDLDNNEENFNEYFEDFLEDLGSISDKFNYKEFIGRPRKWRNDFFAIDQASQDMDICALFDQNIVEDKSKRKCELLISLLIGSINDIEKVGADEPETLLEKVKRILYYLMEIRQDLYIKILIKKQFQYKDCLALEKLNFCFIN